LQQLLQQQSNIPEAFFSLYRSHKTKSTRLSLTECAQELQSVCVRRSTVFIVIDALDECAEGDSTREEVLSVLSNVQPALRLLITARPHIAEVLNTFKDATRLEIRASEEDIRRYLEGRTEKEKKLKYHIKKDPTLQGDIMTAIVEKVDGMSVLESHD
jgi:hypothetical protein